MNSTDICNQALAFLGGDTIVSLEEDSESARKCRLFYDQARRTLLLEYRWNFAQRYAKLAFLNAECPGYSYVYKYPAACLTIQKLFDKDDARAPNVAYKEIMVDDSTRAIAADLKDAWCRYTADVRNAEAFDPWFAEALSFKLASRLAMPLAASQSTMQMAEQYAMTYLQYAKQHNAIEDNRDTKMPHGYFDARG